MEGGGDMEVRCCGLAPLVKGRGWGGGVLSLENSYPASVVQVPRSCDCHCDIIEKNGAVQ